MFRLNIDGVPGSEASEVPILAGDSLYVFVEVTVDPDQPISISPFIIEEELIIRSGSNEKNVVLEAWGQNANYFPSKNAQGQLVGLTCNLGEIVWDDTKPYVIYGLLFIDSCTLVFPPGAQIYVHGGIARIEETIFSDGGLIFLPNGKMLSQGSKDRPVVFQSDRLEPDFEDVSGQWAGIRMVEGSRDHILSNTEIRNSIVGIRADSSSSVALNSVTIANTSNIGLIGIHAEITADNSLIHSNGAQSLAMIYGGNYTYRHCTFANYQNQAAAVYMDNFTCLNNECSAFDVNPLNATFINSIIMGSNDDEIDLNDITEGADESAFNLVLDHTLVKVEDEKNEYPADACLNCLDHMDEPVFLDEIENIYSLDTMSVARDQGVPISNLNSDILGIMRDVDTPDIGCFEFIE